MELEEIIAKVVEASTGQTIPAFKSEAIVYAKEVEALLQKDYPVSVLDIVRPNEPTKVKEYRASVYEPIIRADFYKVLTTLQKIRLSEGFKIDVPEKLKDSDFATYLSDEFPLTFSFQNWVFNYMLSRKLIDSNAVCMVYPSNFKEANEEPKPYPYIFETEKVLCFSKDLVACLDKIDRDGGRYISAVTPTDFYYIHIPAKGQISYEVVNHDIGECPAFKLGGQMAKTYQGEVLYNSFVAPCLPHWRRALRSADDYNASLILHVNPEKWQYTNRLCKACKSRGKDTHGNDCNSCGGSGYELVSTPFGVHTIHPEKVSIDQQAAVVTPPAGYITKPTSDIEYLGGEVKQQLYYALRAINLEFLGQEYLNQSGAAKEMDRQEVKSFLYQVAQSLIEANIKPAIAYITYWWFKGMPENIRFENTPLVSLPKDFDILSATMLRERVQALKDGNFNPSIIAEAEKQYFAKEYGKDSLEYSVLANASELDPLHGKTVAEKQQLLMSGVIDRVVFVASARIRDFVKNAIEANQDFNTLTRSRKQQIIYDFAKQEIARQNLAILPNIEE